MYIYMYVCMYVLSFKILMKSAISRNIGFICNY